MQFSVCFGNLFTVLRVIGLTRHEEKMTQWLGKHIYLKEQKTETKQIL